MSNLYEPQSLFSHDVYTMQDTSLNVWYYGTVTERSTGQQVYKSDRYLIEGDAIEDVLDWIEVEEFVRIEFEEE